jgi:hypothetical protein
VAANRSNREARLPVLHHRRIQPRGLADCQQSAASGVGTPGTIVSFCAFGSIGNIAQAEYDDKCERATFGGAWAESLGDVAQAGQATQALRFLPVLLDFTHAPADAWMQLAKRVPLRRLGT